MDESPERLNRVLARWWRKILVTECAEVPDGWEYWEHTKAGLSEDLQSQEGEDQKTAIREPA